MRIVVSDTSCLIDLRKASLLEPFLELPYEILIPNALFEDELFKFTAAQKRALLRGGLKVVDLPGEQVLRARHFVQKAPRLSIHDGFALALAEFHAGCILLTGDGGFTPLQSTVLSGVAERLGVTSMQVALAWLLHRAPNILLIPGTSSLAHLRENLAAARLTLTSARLAELDGIAAGASPARP